MKPVINKYKFEQAKKEAQKESGECCQKDKSTDICHCPDNKEKAIADSHSQKNCECEKDNHATAKIDGSTCPHCAAENKQTKKTERFAFKNSPISKDCCSKSEHEHEEESCGCGIEHKKANKQEGKTCNSCGTDSQHTENCCGTPKRAVNKELIYMAISFVALVVSFLNPFNLDKYWKLADPAIIAIILCGLPIYRGAINNLIKKKKITSALLISTAMTASIIMAILGAFLSLSGHDHGESYFFVAGEVAFLMSIGSYIEDKTAGKSRDAIKELINLKPAVALVKTINGYLETPVRDIKVGDIVMVKPNGLIPMDGTLLTAIAEINQANLTGESAPKEVRVGQVVFAGTQNLSQPLELEVTQLADDSTVSKLIDYVKSAEKNKAPIARIADKFAGYIVPMAIGISIAVFFIALFGFKTDALTAVERAITILVVFCPCALALATPTAISAGIGNASKKGILIKNGQALESLSKINTICFDKTGTLTEGKLEVTQVVNIDITKEDLLYYAASAETFSEHPIAKAIIEQAPVTSQPSATESLVGIGVQSIVDGKTVLVEKASALTKEELTRIGFDQNNTKTAVVVKIDSIIKGIIYLADKIRDGAAIAISQLNGMGYKTVMLTGDNAATAKAVADNLGISDYRAELMPLGKVDAIQQIKNSNQKVMMIGDGVNDSPSLALADSSVAMGVMGNSIAIDTASVALMTNDLKKIPILLRLSKVTLRTIVINITISMAINFVAVILSTLGNLNAVTGALVHNISSILVCLNSALIIKQKFSVKQPKSR